MGSINEVKEILQDAIPVSENMKICEHCGNTTNAKRCEHFS